VCGGNLKKSNTQSKGDGIVSAVLDEVIELKGWGPEAIFPECTLGLDLEMSENEIKEFAHRLNKKLSLGEVIDFTGWKDFSLKQVVDQIRKYQPEAA
jgi:hypothetical protein